MRERFVFGKKNLQNSCRTYWLQWTETGMMRVLKDRELEAMQRDNHTQKGMKKFGYDPYIEEKKKSNQKSNEQ